MSARTLEAPRFVRRTSLGPSEYRKNFRQIDGDVISAVTSREADRITPLMSKIYLKLVHAPAEYWERDGVLRFEGKSRDDGHVTAWSALCEVLGVASATASKALCWMHEQGIIGYFAGKNGVGIRVFLNRATSSIGSKAAGKKILEFPPASSGGARTSSNEVAFSDSYAVLEGLETDLNPRAPKDGAESTKVVKSTPSPQRAESTTFQPETTRTIHGTPDPSSASELTQALLVRLEPAVRAAATQAAAREHERTREWLESRGLPKAARVAQREAYNVLRKCGLIREGEGTSYSFTGVGRSTSAPAESHHLSEQEVEELAGACVALLEVKGQSIGVTLTEMSVTAGGFLLPDDAPRVREKAFELLKNSPCERGSEERPG